jgi:hypothetical protein
MKKFVIRFTSDIELSYDLVEHEIAEHWASLIIERNTNELCPINHYSACYNPLLMQKRIDRLYELIDYINPHVPRKIEKVLLLGENHQDGLNKMHTHFPELEYDDNFAFLRKHLSEYNDTIHWLEPVLLDYYQDNRTNSKFSINLDFNKINPPLEKYVIPESAYSLFNGYFNFGQLMLHYVHVGRHAWELYHAKDLVCPKDQYVPQSLYNASARLHFCDRRLINPLNKDRFYRSWEKFYNDRGGLDFFGVDIDDPSIRFGYCQIGSLTKITVNGTEIEFLKSHQQMSNFRNLLVTTSVVNWDIT